MAYSDDTPGVTYQYDAYNRLMQQEDGIGLTAYSYDANSRLLSVDGPWDNDTLTYQYDVLGRRTGVTPQSGTAISYSYDTLNRLTQIESGSRAYAYAYNGINPLVQSLTRPNGSSTAYLYDILNRLTSIANKTSADAVLTQHVFTYNPQDLRGSENITRNASVASPTDQLTTYQYNALNQLLEETGPAKSFVYDADGNMTQGYTLYGYSMNAAYDAENRLTQTEFTDAASVIHRARYYYGADNLLRKKQVYANGALAAESRYVLDGFNVVQERDSSNAVLREYTWGLNRGGGIGGLLDLRQGGQNYSYLYDGKGNVDGLIDDAETMVAGYVYSAFGHLLTKTGTLDQPFRFSTKAFDEQTGLAYYGYRFYSPGVGRWINRDPIGEAGGMNLYGFVGNGPVNFFDPLGLAESEKITIISNNTSFGDHFLWWISPKSGLIKDNQSSLAQIAQELSKGNKKVKQLNISGHSQLGGTSLQKTNTATQNFTGRALIDPANASIVQQIKSQLDPSGTVTIYSCKSGTNIQDLKNISKELGINARAFTGNVSSGPGSIFDSGNWIEVTPSGAILQ